MSCFKVETKVHIIHTINDATTQFLGSVAKHANVIGQMLPKIQDFQHIDDDEHNSNHSFRSSEWGCMDRK